MIGLHRTSQLRPVLVLMAVMAMALPAPLQAQGEMAPTRKVMAAFKKQGSIRWQGIRELQIGGEGAAVVVVQDGFDPPTGYYTGKLQRGARAIGATETAKLPTGPVAAEESHGPIQTLAGKISFMTPQGMNPFLDRLNRRVTAMKIEQEPTAVSILGGTARGDAFRISPSYKGGGLRVVIDRTSGLPVQVERYGVDNALRYKTTYRSIKADVAAKDFWFSDAVAHPEKTVPFAMINPQGHLPQGKPPQGREPKGPLPGGPPPHMQGGRPGPNDPPPIVQRSIRSFMEGVLPEGFELEPSRRMISMAPLPTMHFVLSDGLNPISLVAIRLPRGMDFPLAEERSRNRLRENVQAHGTPAVLRRQDNWLLIAGGEVDGALLTKVVERAALRLGDLQGLMQQLEGRKGQAGAPRGERGRPPHEGGGGPPPERGQRQRWTP